MVFVSAQVDPIAPMKNSISPVAAAMWVVTAGGGLGRDGDPVLVHVELAGRVGLEYTIGTRGEQARQAVTRQT